MIIIGADYHPGFQQIASYSETGRPSIDPELLLRILLIGYLYGITSERKLVEELRMHLAEVRHGNAKFCDF